MTKIAMVVLAVLVFAGVAQAQEVAQATGTYADAMRTCGAEWRASEARKAVKKGEGNAAWQAFRAECTKRVGYTTKRRGSVGPAPASEGTKG